MSEETKRGSNGGIARKEKLTPEQRSAIAVAAAKKRWGKVQEDPKVEKLKGISVEELGPQTVAQVQKVILIREMETALQEQANPTPEPKENHCPACVAGEPLGKGVHIAGSAEHPFPTKPTQIIDAPPVFVEVPPQQKPTRRQPRPMPKEFKSASSYAERRLPLAIKEKSEHVGAVAKLDAEINDLVRVINALGGKVDPQAMQPMYPPMNYGAPGMPFPAVAGTYPMAPPNPAFQAPPDTGIDPNLFTANSGPVPGTPSIPPGQLIPRTSAGGAMDLDYVPREEEEKLPSMGKGWV